MKSLTKESSQDPLTSGSNKEINIDKTCLTSDAWCSDWENVWNVGWQEKQGGGFLTT